MCDAQRVVKLGFNHVTKLIYLFAHEMDGCLVVTITNRPLFLVKGSGLLDGLMNVEQPKAKKVVGGNDAGDVVLFNHCLVEPKKLCLDFCFAVVSE